jgi:hypothetical protein
MIRILAICAVAAVPTTAQAQDSAMAGGRLEIAGTAPNACVMRAPTAGNGVNATFEPSGAGSARIRITELVDPATALGRQASMDLVVPVICNGPHLVTLRSGSGGLRRQGNPVQGTGFGTMLPYAMNLSWVSDQAQAASDSGGPLVLTAGGARAGQLSLQIAVASGTRPLVAGSYSDQIILEFQAAN